MIRVEVVETSILRTDEKLRFAVAVEINRGRAAGMARHVATGEVASRTGEFMVVFAKAGVIRSPIVSLTVTLRPTLRTKGIRVRQVWSCVRRPRPPTIDAEETIPCFRDVPTAGKKAKSTISPTTTGAKPRSCRRNSPTCTGSSLPCSRNKSGGCNNCVNLLCSSQP